VASRIKFWLKKLTSRTSSRPPETKKDMEANTHPNTTRFRGVFNKLNLAWNKIVLQLRVVMEVWSESTLAWIELVR
jgi:hypothetical protein